MTYEQKRQAYWDAQTEFRRASIDEIRRLLPPEVDRVIFDMNDDPRLEVVDLVDAYPVSVIDWKTGATRAGDATLLGTVDRIVRDMDIRDFDEAEKILSTDDNGTLYITRDAQ